VLQHLLQLSGIIFHIQIYCLFLICHPGFFCIRSTVFTVNNDLIRHMSTS
jgi:hypothetical protein